MYDCTSVLVRRRPDHATVQLFRYDDIQHTYTCISRLVSFLLHLMSKWVAPSPVAVKAIH